MMILQPLQHRCTAVAKLLCLIPSAGNNPETIIADIWSDFWVLHRARSWTQQSFMGPFQLWVLYDSINVWFKLSCCCTLTTARPDACLHQGTFLYVMYMWASSAPVSLQNCSLNISSTLPKKEVTRLLLHSTWALCRDLCAKSNHQQTPGYISSLQSSHAQLQMLCSVLLHAWPSCCRYRAPRVHSCAFLGSLQQSCWALQLQADWAFLNKAWHPLIKCLTLFPGDAN